MRTTDYYNQKYFDLFQAPIGKLGGIYNRFKFQKHIKSSDIVLDFGCGGGFLLNNLIAKQKIGVEVNQFARSHAKSLGIECYESLDFITDNSIDVIISNHVFEHIENPFYYFKALLEKLKVGGKIIVYVPLDSRKYYFSPNDINQHFFSFSPMNLGNILHASGYSLQKASVLYHKWPPYFNFIHRYLGKKIFHFLSFIYGRINYDYVQVYAIATRPN